MLGFQANSELILFKVLILLKMKNNQMLFFKSCILVHHYFITVFEFNVVLFITKKNNKCIK